VTYDLITVGRVTMDLHAQNIGAPFEEVVGFDTMVGGSPTNIAIGSARLGLRPIAFTGVGDDLVGDYVLRYLRDEGVETAYVMRKPGKRTSLALVAVQPPDRFPLSFYREDPADIYLTVEDAAALPFDAVPAVLLSGNAFSRGTCADAARYCAEHADREGITTYMDLDLRPTEWSEPRAYGCTLRSILPLVDDVIGTEEEFYAALAPDPDEVIAGEAIDQSGHAVLEELLDQLVGDGAVETVILKRGPRGVTVISSDGRADVPGFEVDAVNTVGAGDAFAAGLIRSRLLGWDWHRSARFANACGAIQVTRHGCSASFPTERDVTAFVDAHGGM
jgi:5-dehydro-2-deoxygluconokinase